MIRGHRRRHRLVWHVLGVVLPVLVVGATMARRPPPRQALPDAIHSAVVGGPPGPGELLASSDSLWPGLPVRTMLERADSGWGLRVQPLEDLRRPDLLLYWSPTPHSGEGGLADGVVLLGTIAGTQVRRMRLPGDPGSGWLVLYSLAHHEVVASAELAALEAEERIE